MNQFYVFKYMPSKLTNWNSVQCEALRAFCNSIRNNAIKCVWTVVFISKLAVKGLIMDWLCMENKENTSMELLRVVSQFGQNHIFSFFLIFLNIEAPLCLPIWYNLGHISYMPTCLKLEHLKPSCNWHKLVRWNSMAEFFGQMISSGI